MSYGEGRLMLGTGGLSPGILELLRPPSKSKGTSAPGPSIQSSSSNSSETCLLGFRDSDKCESPTEYAEYDHQFSPSKDSGPGRVPAFNVTHYPLPWVFQSFCYTGACSERRNMHDFSQIFS